MMPAHKSITPNPPIKGHELIREGRNSYSAGHFYGGCHCGAHPGEVIGATAMRRWHREHKTQLREGI